jgi:hypothetical protein
VLLCSAALIIYGLYHVIPAVAAGGTALAALLAVALWRGPR